MLSLTPATNSSQPLDVPAVVPVPRCELAVRQAVMEDVPFIDALQKMHTHMVGFLRFRELQGHIKEGRCLVAEEQGQVAAGGGAIPIGYVIARYEYMKRDEVGMVYQLNVMQLRQRHLVGATLIKAVFDGAPYGCRLFSCWCAQDIQANWFWESLGFVPLAFRTGSRSKQRIHIFWQRRVRENDDSTPYWFPSKTQGGSVGEDRLVLPIPLDTHWRDVKPVVLPGLPDQRSEVSDQLSEQKMLAGGAAVKPRPEQPKLTAAQKAAIHRSASKHLQGVPLGKKAVIGPSGIRYVDRTDYVPETDGPDELAETLTKPKKPRRAGPRHKNDPRYEAAARELRDRFLEEVNLDRCLPAAYGKYDVSRQLEASRSTLEPVRMLEQKHAA